MGVIRALVRTLHLSFVPTLIYTYSASVRLPNRLRREYWGLDFPKVHCVWSALDNIIGSGTCFIMTGQSNMSSWGASMEFARDWKLTNTSLDKSIQHQLECDSNMCVILHQFRYSLTRTLHKPIDRWTLLWLDGCGHYIRALCDTTHEISQNQHI